MYGRNRYGTTKYGDSGGRAIFSKSLSAVVNVSGSVARAVSKSLVGTINADGSVGRAIAKALAATVNISGTVARAMTKALAATVNISGTLTKVKIFHKALAVTINISGTVARSIGKGIAGTINVSGDVSNRHIAKGIVAVVNISGTVGRAIARAYGGGVQIAGSVGRVIHKQLVATVNTSGSVARGMGKGILGIINISGDVSDRHITKAIAATVNISGKAGRGIGKALAATVNISGSLARSVGKGILGLVNIAGDVSERHITKGIVAVVNISGTVGRGISKAFAAVVNISGTVVRSTGKVVGGGVQIAGVVGRVIHKKLVATMNVGATVARSVYDMAYEMNKTIRQIYGRVRITYSDPFFSAGIEAEASETGRFTYPAQVVDNVETEAYKWFSLHRNVLDGTFHPLPSNQEYSVGWWGATLSNAVTAAFTPGTQVLTITHAARTIESLLVVGDDKLVEYPVAFTVKLYTAGDVLVHTETVPANAAVRWSTDLTPTHEDVVKQVLDITEWSRVSSVAKIAQFFTMLEETYDSEDGELFSIRVLEEREFTEPTIPQGNISSNVLTVRLNNIDYLFTDGNYHSRLSGLLLNNRAIKAWLGCDSHTGVRIWLPLGTFYSRDWKAPEGEPWAEVGGYDLLDRLKQTEFSISEVYTNITMHDLAITVMTDAGLTDADWEIDPVLDTADYTIPYAWFNRMSHREALRIIAAAALGQVYCDRDGKIVLEVYVAPAAQPYDFEFDQANFFEVDHPLEWSQMINVVEARANPRVSADEQDICFDDDDFTVPGSSSVTKTHFFDFSPCVDVVDPLVFTQSDSHITLDSMTIYAWGVSAVYSNSDPGDEDVESVTIRGKPLEVQGGRIVTSEDETSVASNGRQTLSSPITSEFWQGETKAQDVADALLASYKDPRRDVLIKARGNIALLLGDRVIAPDYKDEVTSEYGLMRQDINFDGAMDVAITGQRIIDGHTIYHKSLVATMNIAGGIVVAPNHHTGEIEIAGSVGRAISKSLVATMNVAVTAGRKTAKALAGDVNVGGAVTRGHVTGKALAATVNVSGAAGREWDYYMGSEPIDRTNAAGIGVTRIVMANPATSDGVIHTVQLYGSAGNNWKVGTFSKAGLNFTPRDYETLATINNGLNEFTGLSIDVLAGDYIGVYIPAAGQIKIDVTGGDDTYAYVGDGFGGVQAYALETDFEMSLRAEVRTGG